MRIYTSGPFIFLDHIVKLHAAQLFTTLLATWSFAFLNAQQSPPIAVHKPLVIVSVTSAARKQNNTARWGTLAK